jgi:hypothetical protein
VPRLALTSTRKMRRTLGFRLGATAVFISAMLAHTVGFWIRTSLLRAREGEDFVGLHERRLAPTRDLLGERREVGYVSSEQTGAPFRSANLWGFENDEGRVTFFLTQYALAPVIVLNDRTLPVLVTAAIEEVPRLPGYRGIRGVAAGAEVLFRANQP